MNTVETEIFAHEMNKEVCKNIGDNYNNYDYVIAKKSIEFACNQILDTIKDMIESVAHHKETSYDYDNGYLDALYELRNKILL